MINEIFSKPKLLNLVFIYSNVISDHSDLFICWWLLILPAAPLLPFHLPDEGQYMTFWLWDDGILWYHYSLHSLSWTTTSIPSSIEVEGWRRPYTTGPGGIVYYWYLRWNSYHFSGDWPTATYLRLSRYHSSTGLSPPDYIYLTIPIVVRYTYTFSDAVDIHSFYVAFYVHFLRRLPRLPVMQEEGILPPAVDAMTGEVPLLFCRYLWWLEWEEEFYMIRRAILPVPSRCLLSHLWPFYGRTAVILLEDAGRVSPTSHLPLPRDSRYLVILPASHGRGRYTRCSIRWRMPVLPVDFTV